MLKKRRSRHRLIFNMGIPIPGKDGLYIEIGHSIKKSQNGDLGSMVIQTREQCFALSRSSIPY